MNHRISILLLWMLLLSSQGIASKLVELNDEADEYALSESTTDIYIDKSRSLDIKAISSATFAHYFTNAGKRLQQTSLEGAYWIRFKLKNNSARRKVWMLEFYDNRLDNIQVYVPLKTGGFELREAGDLHRFDQKELEHINFIFQLQLEQGEEQTFYVRMDADHDIYSYGVIRSVEKLFDYTTTEYFLLAMYYGILLAMAVYNLFMYFSIRDVAHLYYVLYVIAIFFYCMSREGMGFQFIWYNHPEINLYIEPTSLFLMVIFALLYAKSFLNTAKEIPVINQAINYIIVIRTLIFLYGMLISHDIIRSIFLDMVPLFLAFITGFLSYRKGFKPARFYILAFTALFVGFSIISVEAMGFTINSAIAFYSFNIGVMIQMIILSFALADRVRVIIVDRNQTQDKLIDELREKEQMKDKINLQLEEMVKSRTIELEEKNKQLDAFVYKASHDIKGPLRSLIGLTKVGMKDVKEKTALEYFEHILKTSTKLDEILADLLAITKVKQSEIKKVKVDFRSMIYEILSSFEHLQGYNRTKVEIDIKQDRDFMTDEKMLYSILQNFTENAVKYQDYSKDDLRLNIRVRVDSHGALIEFEDNGTGIEKEYLDKIFDMFFKVNESSLGTGLGLYIVKQAAEKLSAEVRVSSKKGKGSSFVARIPH